MLGVIEIFFWYRKTSHLRNTSNFLLVTWIFEGFQQTYNLSLRMFFLYSKGIVFCRLRKEQSNQFHRFPISKLIWLWYSQRLSLVKIKIPFFYHKDVKLNSCEHKVIISEKRGQVETVNLFRPEFWHIRVLYASTTFEPTYSFW